MIKVGSHMINVDGLKKRFGKLRVLKGLDLEIEAGAVTAIVGHNGSGKTTLIKCILGLVTPDAGRIFFDGQKLSGAWQYRERIGYMPQAARFPENLCAADVIAILKDLRGRPERLDEELIDAFRLKDELHKPSAPSRAGRARRSASSTTGCCSSSTPLPTIRSKQPPSRFRRSIPSTWRACCCS